MDETCQTARTAIENESYDQAIGILRPRAAAGLAEAQFLMGYLYFTSAEVTKSDSREWLEHAAAQNHPEAIYYLACMGDELDFAPPEDERHAELLIRSAELGWSEAQRDLGCFYATGESPFPKDEVAGRLWYGRAAEQGHADAQYNYGLMLLYGEGGAVDRDAGLAWIRRAAEQEHYWAIRYLETSADECS